MQEIIKATVAYYDAKTELVVYSKKAPYEAHIYVYIPSLRGRILPQYVSKIHIGNAELAANSGDVNLGTPDEQYRSYFRVIRGTSWESVQEEAQTYVTALFTQIKLHVQNFLAAQINRPKNTVFEMDVLEAQDGLITRNFCS